MTDKRSKLEMMVAILDAIDKGAHKQMHVEGATGVNHAVCVAIIEHLTARKMVFRQTVGRRYLYFIMYKGWSALQHWRSLKTQLGER